MRQNSTKAIEKHSYPYGICYVNVNKRSFKSGILKSGIQSPSHSWCSHSVLFTYEQRPSVISYSGREHVVQMLGLGPCAGSNSRDMKNSSRFGTFHSEQKEDIFCIVLGNWIKETQCFKSSVSENARDNSDNDVYCTGHSWC